MKIFIIFSYLSLSNPWVIPKCTLNPNSNRINPKALISTTAKEYPTSNSSVGVGVRILSSSAANVVLTCFADFPVEWVFDDDSDAGDQVNNPTLYNERRYKDFGNSSTFTYYSNMVLYFRARVSKAQIFSCQQASMPCHRRLFTSKPENGGFYTDIYWRNDLNIPELDEQQGFKVEHKKSNTTIVSGSQCDAFFYYGLRDLRWAFCCKSAQGLWGLPVVYAKKYASALENIQRKSSLQPQSCIIPVDNFTNACNTNETETLHTLKNYGIKCGITSAGMSLYHPMIKVLQSISQGLGSPSKIYFNWADIVPEEMIRLELSDPVMEFKNNFLNVACYISLSYYSYGGFIALEDSERGLIVYKDDANWANADQRYSRSFNGYKVEKTVSITTTTVGLYCFAPIWNATSWVNKSVSVIPLDPEPLRIANLKDMQRITWNLGDENRSLNCTVTGLPITEIRWIFKNRTRQKKNSNSTIFSTEHITLHFPKVDKTIEGIYRCIAVNYAETTEMSIDLFVHDTKAEKIVAVSAAAASMVVLVLLITVYVLWRKNLMQRRALRMLSPQEVLDFQQGSSKDSGSPLAVWQKPYITDHEIARHRLTIYESDVLGKGAFGVVYKGKINISTTGTLPITIPVAVKTVPKDVDIIYLKALLSELKILASIRSEKHPHIVALAGACTEDLKKREVFVALEFCSNGSLKDHLSTWRRKLNETYVNIDWTQQKESVISKNLILQLSGWSYEIADGMQFLASKNVIHGDLAARNVLLDEKFVPKIGDFGLARVLADPIYIKKKSSQCPLPWKWMAIESLDQMNFSIKSDVWSYGILLWELYSLAQIPYPGVTWTTAFVQDLKNGMRCSQPPFASVEIYNLMLACWRREPSERLEFQELHSSLKKIHEFHKTSEKTETTTEATYVFA